MSAYFATQPSPPNVFIGVPGTIGLEQTRFPAKARGNDEFHALAALRTLALAALRTLALAALRTLGTAGAR